MPDTVTLDLSKFDIMRNQIKDLLASNAKLQQEAASRPMAGANDEEAAALIKSLQGGLRAAVEVCKFAVGNLHWESIVGWPHAALKEAADAVTAMPGATEIEKEWAFDVVRFARDAERMADVRANRPRPRNVDPAAEADVFAAGNESA